MHIARWSGLGRLHNAKLQGVVARSSRLSRSGGNDVELGRYSWLRARVLNPHLA
jgi:hypothetical protein